MKCFTRSVVGLFVFPMAPGISHARAVRALQRAGFRIARTKVHLDHQSHNSHYASMREITAKEAKNRFGQLLRSAQQGPVRVTRNGTPVGVVLSVEQFERLRGTAWDRLAAAMDAMSREAAAKGLTPAALESLLSDES